MENGKSVPRQGATSSLAMNNGTKRRNDNGTMRYGCHGWWHVHGSPVQ